METFDGIRKSTRRVQNTATAIATALCGNVFANLDKSVNVSGFTSVCAAVKQSRSIDNSIIFWRT